MKKHRAGGFLLVLVGLGAAGALSCQAGTLPCDPNDRACACQYQSCADAGSGGAGGGNGGKGGNGGQGGTGGKEVEPPGPDSQIDCAEYPTLADMDQWFEKRCGIDSQCHNGDTWSNFKLPEVWDRMRDAAPKFTCKKDKMINTADWQKSIILLKGKTSGTPKCVTGTGGGTIMPPPNNTQKVPPLTAAEAKCLESFVKVAAGAP